MKRRIVRIEITSRNPNESLDEIRDFIDGLNEGKLPDPSHDSDADLRPTLDDQVATHVVDETREYLERIEQDKVIEKVDGTPVADQHNRLIEARNTIGIEAVEEVAAKILAALLQGGFVAVVLKGILG